MELLNEFGFQPILFVAQIVNFLVIFFILKKFLYKPTLELLKRREQTIKEGLQKAEESQKTLEKIKEEEKKVLRNARYEAKKMLEQTLQQSKELAKQQEESTKAHTERMIQEAKEQIARESKQAEKQLTVHVSKLAIEFLQKTATELFGENEQEEIIMKAIKKLKQQPN